MLEEDLRPLLGDRSACGPPEVFVRRPLGRCRAEQASDVRDPGGPERDVGGDDEDQQQPWNADHQPRHEPGMDAAEHAEGLERDDQIGIRGARVAGRWVPSRASGADSRVVGRPSWVAAGVLALSAGARSVTSDRGQGRNARVGPERDSSGDPSPAREVAVGDGTNCGIDAVDVGVAEGAAVRRGVTAGLGAAVAGGGAGIAGGGVGAGVGVAEDDATVIGRLIGSRKVSPLQSSSCVTSATQV